jgi:hypothetical protein
MSDTETRGDDTNAPEFPSDMDEADLAAYVSSEVTLDYDAAGKWREEARTAYDFVAGRQWSPEDEAILKEQLRPPVTFNRTAPMIDAVAGAQVNNRQEIKLLPRSGDDGGKAELLGGVLRWVRDQCDAEDEESEAFVDAAISGMGWLETRMCYDDDPAGRIVIERRDPFEMGWDRSARKRNLADANHLWSRQQFSLEYVSSKWPNFATASRANSERPDAPRRTVVHPTRDQYADGDDVTADDTDDITVTHFQWCERRPVYRVLNPATQQIETFDQAAWDALGEKLAEQRDTLQHVMQSEKKWFQVFESGGEVADFSECPDPRGSTFKCITGRRDRNRRQFYGIVRAVIDPQRWANKWLAQSLHIVNTSAKSGWIYEDGAIEDARKFEEDIAKAGSNVKVAAGALTGGRIREKVPPPFPQAFDRLLQFAVAAIPDVTGINREMLGTVDREQAGILEAQRKQASQAVLAPLFDSLRRYFKEEGRLLLVFVQKYVPPDQMIRITMPDGRPENVAMAMLPDASTYDIIVDQAPSSPNQKMEVWQNLQPMLPAMMKTVPGPVLLKLLKFSPLPESVVKEIEEEVAKMAQQPKAPDPAIEKIKADIEAQQARTQMDLQMKQADMQLAREMAEMEYANEMRKAQMELELQRIRAENEIAIARMKAQHDAQIRQQAAEVDISITERKATIEADKRVQTFQAEKEVFSEPVRELIAPLAEAIDRTNALQAEMARKNDETAQQLAAMLQQVAQMVSAEKELVRDPVTGRASGVRIKQARMN